MAFLWHPFSAAEFDQDILVVQLPSSGLFARVAGPIVELLSQLPFEDVEEAVKVWQERTGVGDSSLKLASKVWHQLCDWEIIQQVDLSDPLLPNESLNWITLTDRKSPSHIMRFLDVQDFYGGEDASGDYTEDPSESGAWSMGA